MHRFLVKGAGAPGAITLPAGAAERRAASELREAASAALKRCFRALFEAALVSASPAVEIGKLLPFKL